jgi:hypothetical protein
MLLGGALVTKCSLESQQLSRRGWILAYEIHYTQISTDLFKGKVRLARGVKTIWCRL